MDHRRRTEHFEPVLNVSGHVNPARIVVAQVDHCGGLAALFLLDQTLAGSPHLALTRVALAGEIGHVELGADAFKHADEGFLLDPDLNIVLLPLPEVDGVLVRARSARCSADSSNANWFAGFACGPRWRPSRSGQRAGRR